MSESPLAKQIQSLLSQHQPDSRPLVWTGNPRFPDGARRRPVLDQLEWERLYWFLANARDASSVKHPLQLKAQLEAVRPDGPVPIAIAYFDVDQPARPFLGRVKAAAKSGKALEPPPSDLASVLRTQTVFMAAGLLAPQFRRELPVHRGRDVTFVLSADYHLTNLGRLPKVEVDLADGKGYRAIGFDEPFTVRADRDTVEIEVRCRYGRRRRRASLSVTVSDAPAPPRPDETWRLRDGNVTGRAFVYHGAGHHSVIDPLIVAEGFPGGYSDSYLYELMNQAGTADALRAAGYDLIMVRFDQGLRPMQDNARIVAACIRAARLRTSRPLIVGGFSMGGLIARFALTSMEHRSEAHGARVFFTVDTPHRGSYTSLAAQWFVHAFKAVSGEMQLLSALLDSPANQQFVMQWLRDGMAETSPLRTAFADELEQMGSYPQKTRLLAIACGRGDGKRSVKPYRRMLSWTHSPFIRARLHTLPAKRQGERTIGEGGWLLSPAGEPKPLNLASDVAWEGVPGGQNYYTAMAARLARDLGCGHVAQSPDLARTCSVPTVSALDIDADPFTPVPPQSSGVSPFHDYFVCAQDEDHVVITPEASAWLRDRLGTPP